MACRKKFVEDLQAPRHGRPGPIRSGPPRVSTSWSRPSAYRSWIKHLIADRDDGETLVLAVPTRFQRDWIRSNYINIIARITGRKVELVVTAYAKVRAHEARSRRALSPNAATGRGGLNP